MNYTMYPCEGLAGTGFTLGLARYTNGDSALSVDRSFLIKLVSL